MTLSLNDLEPFSTIGINNFGTFYVKHIHSSCMDLIKAWGAIYTCAASRTIIPDRAPDPSSHTFIRSFSRVSRKECLEHAISDYWCSFLLPTIQENFQSITECIGILICLSPHCMVGSLRGLCELQKHLTYEELSTLLKIERIVNNVPITYLYPNNLRLMCYPKSLTIVLSILFQLPANCRILREI